MTDAFALIDDGCWKLISQFAAPPDGMSISDINVVYCLQNES